MSFERLKSLKRIWSECYTRGSPKNENKNHWYYYFLLRELKKKAIIVLYEMRWCGERVRKRWWGSAIFRLLFSLVLLVFSPRNIYFHRITTFNIFWIFFQSKNLKYRTERNEHEWNVNASVSKKVEKVAKKEGIKKKSSISRHLIAFFPFFADVSTRVVLLWLVDG